MNNKGILLVISGPAGVGKGTVCKEFMSRSESAFLSVSMTTRQPREGEVEGVNYFFRSKEEFDALVKENKFLEYAEFCGNSYGTPREAVEKRLSCGEDVILEIEVQGALQVKEKFKECVLIFVVPPSFEELRDRLVGRATETPEVVEKRLRRAKEEFELIPEYDYILMNDTVEQAVERLESIVTAEKTKTSRNTEFINTLK